MFATVLTFPHAKINLGLHVLGKRADGYHAIESVLLPIALRDALEAIVDPSVPEGEVVFTRTGRPVPGDAQEDLCVKAHQALRALGTLPGVRMHLHKAIPIGAGLGGGSSDGTHALRLLNDLLSLGLDDATLHRLAAGLGSDCPFFLQEQAQLATGRGEVLTPMNVDLRGWWLVLINPGVHVSTAEVYKHTPHAPAPYDLAQVVGASSPTAWSGTLVNVMEHYVLSAYPEVEQAKRRIVDAGATYAAMSGSGSSVFGLFKTRPSLPMLPAGQQAWVLPL